jgi:hypothetical protein
VTAPPQPPAATLDWDEVLAWRPWLADRTTELGGWHGGDRSTDGSLTMPAARLSDEAARFLQELYDRQVVAPFDWGAWAAERGRDLLEQDRALDGASLEECRMLLASLARSDRFVDGAFLHALSDGTISRILGRIDHLLRHP